jgi:hypothetical protein
MHVALLVARVLLVCVFTMAGVTKLADRPRSKQALVDFGVPASLAAPLGVLLPLAELAVAVALIPASTAWWGACRQDQRKCGPRPRAELPLFRPAALGTRRLEDPRAQRGPGRHRGLRLPWLRLPWPRNTA